MSLFRLDRYLMYIHRDICANEKCQILQEVGSFDTEIDENYHRNPHKERECDSLFI